MKPLFMHDNLLSNLSSGDVALSSMYRISPECVIEILKRFQPRTWIPSGRLGCKHTHRLVAAACLSVDVLLMCHHLLVPHASELTYEKDCVHALPGIEGNGGHLSDRLPPFSEFLTRFNKAASTFSKLSASAGIDYPKKLTRVHGLAWKEINQHLPDEVGDALIR